MLGVSREPLADCVERVLAEDVAADRDQPPFDRVTMDGIAIAGRDWESGVRAFEIAGTQAAGAPPLALGGPARCVESHDRRDAAARRGHRDPGRADYSRRAERRR